VYVDIIYIYIYIRLYYNIHGGGSIEEQWAPACNQKVCGDGIDAYRSPPQGKRVEQLWQRPKIHRKNRFENTNYRVIIKRNPKGLPPRPIFSVAFIII